MMGRRARQRERAAATRTEGTDEVVGPQERVERSSAGRAAISTFIVFVLGALLASNLPGSELRSTIEPRFEPFLEATGLRQTWNLFAPNPRSSTEQLEARLTYADGTMLVWQPPTADPVVGTYRVYRWRKWAHQVMRNRSLWRDTAEWLGRNHQRDGTWPERILLVKKSFRPPPPGSGESHRPDWNEEVFFIASFGPDGPAEAES